MCFAQIAIKLIEAPDLVPEGHSPEGYRAKKFISSYLHRNILDFCNYLKNEVTSISLIFQTIIPSYKNY